MKTVTPYDDDDRQKNGTAMPNRRGYLTDEGMEGD
jgi:hypothetical protein